MGRTARQARLRRVPATVGLLLVLGACGGVSSSGGTESAQHVIAAAVDASEDAGSTRFEFNVDMHVGGQTVGAHGAGVFDQSGKEGSFTFDIGALAGLGNGLGFEMRVVDGVAHMDFGSLFALAAGTNGVHLPDGVRWLRIDPAALGISPQDVADNFGAGSSSADPHALLESLRGVSTDIEELGTDVIDGRKVTGYRAQVDVSKALARLPEQYRDRLAGKLDGFGRTIPVEVWIDEAGLPRRVRETLDLTVGGEHASAVVRMDFVDYGVTVSVQPPPAAETLDFADFLRRVGVDLDQFKQQLEHQRLAA